MQRKLVLLIKSRQINSKISTSPAWETTWARIITTSLSVMFACTVHSVFTGGIHNLADLWLNERLHGSRQIHSEWYYVQFSHLIEVNALVNLPGEEPRAFERASPDLISAAPCTLVRIAGVSLAFPIGTVPWAVWLASLLLLAGSVYTALSFAGSASRLLAVFAAGQRADTTAWRRFGFLRMLAFLAHRLFVMITVISPSVAVFIDLDRTNARLTEAIGYSLSPRVTLWYWIIVLVVSLVYAAFIGFGWLGIRYWQWTRGFQTRCSECGYLADADRCCPECGGIRRTRRVRRRALLASLAAPIIALPAAIIVTYPHKTWIMDATWGGRPGHLQPAHEYIRRVTRMQASQAVMQRLYFPNAWVGDLGQRDWHRFWMQDRDLILETDRYRVEIAVDDDGTFTIHTHDRVDGVTRQTWDRIDERIYGSTYYLEPTRYDAGLLSVVVEQPDPNYAEGLELEQYERAIAVTVEPRYGWCIVEIEAARRDID